MATILECAQRTDLRVGDEDGELFIFCTSGLSGRQTVDGDEQLNAEERNQHERRL